MRTLAAVVLTAVLSGCGGGTTIGTPNALPGGGSGSGTGSPAPGSSASTATASPAATAAPGSTGSSVAAIPFPAATDPDAFYAQPSPFPQKPPGTLLAARSVTYAPDVVPLTNTAYEMKFVSRDQNGQPIAATALVVLPLSPPSGTQDVLVEEFAEDGLGAQCAPSHNLTGGSADSNETEDTPTQTAALQAGYMVIDPDHEGPYSEYANGPLSGYISLDSVRAALQFTTLGLNGKTPFAVEGYSGGAIAAAWTASLEQSYAPNLNIVGVSTGGNPIDIASVINDVDTNLQANKTLFGGIFAAAVGINRAFPQFFTPIFNAAGIATATAIENGCGGKTASGGSGASGSFTNYTTTPNFLSTPGFESGAMLDSLPQAGQTPIAPSLFVYDSQTDELIPIEGPDRMVATWCSDGAKIAYYRVPAGTHAETYEAAVPLVLAYLSAIFSGTTPTYPPMTTTCNE
jgi:hypothetical protein